MRPFLIAVAGGVAIGATNLPYSYIDQPGWLTLFDAAVMALISLVLLSAARTARVRRISGAWVVPGTLAAVLATQWIATTWWPNSGDEYGYRFLADTLLHGRFYNPPPPVADIFGFNWIFTVGAKRFSQYPPGFSALLVPFLAVGVPSLCNPLLTCLLAWLFGATLRALAVARADAAAWTAMLALSPFVLFNGAALFPHMLTAVAVIGIIRLQLAWERNEWRWYLGGIGVLFSILLTTRYEVFAIVAVLYGAGRVAAHGGALLRRGVARAVAAREVLPVVLGGLPCGILFLIYNAAITGRPWRTPFTWASKGGSYGLYAVGDQGVNTPWAALLRNAQWTGELAAYTSAALVLLWVAALVAKARAGRLRYFDLMFPMTLAFFLLFASAGGHRFGPRYWFFTWPMAMLTLANCPLAEHGWLRLRRSRLHVPTLAALHLGLYAGFALTVALHTRHYIALRRAVYATVPPHVPALVLIPSRQLDLSPWQSKPTWAGSADFARNDLDFRNSILYGRADEAGRRQAFFQSLACGVAGRHVYVWREPVDLQPIPCK
jgi:hypothetical protein